MVTHVLEIGTHKRSGDPAAYCRACDEWTSVSLSGPFDKMSPGRMADLIATGLLGGFKPPRCSIADHDEVRHVLPNLVRPTAHAVA